MMATHIAQQKLSLLSEKNKTLCFLCFRESPIQLAMECGANGLLRSKEAVWQLHLFVVSTSPTNYTVLHTIGLKTLNAILNCN